LAFLAGTFSLSIDIFWFRILGFAIGRSFIIFPIIISIFVMAIGAGSLTLKDQSEKKFIKTLFLSVVLSIIPLLVSKVRALITTDVVHISFFIQ